jgi:heat-inducible transcriptional repressor
MAALTPRAEQLLKALIERYIIDGEPVGSRTLSRQSGLELSPATVRNVMADLEDLGLIHSPHTSAGRVPTALGYRVFVDTLLKVRPLDLAEIQRLGVELVYEGSPQQLLESASNLLSQVTRLAGIVMVPRQRQAAFRQIEFLALSHDRVLVILITDDGRVDNRVISPDKRYSPADLVEAANYFNGAFGGRTLEDVKQALLAEMQRDSDAMQRAMSTAMDMARRAFAAGEDQDEDDLVVRGESNLLKIPELGDIEKLRNLFDAFTTKRDLLHLLDQSMRAAGMQVFIGGESGYQSLEACSVVTAPYHVDGKLVGTLGVVGPTRMAYEQVIPIVDVTARLLGSALSGEHRIVQERS